MAGTTCPFLVGIHSLQELSIAFYAEAVLFGLFSNDEEADSSDIILSDLFVFCFTWGQVNFSNSVFCQIQALPLGFSCSAQGHLQLTAPILTPISTTLQ